MLAHALSPSPALVRCSRALLKQLLAEFRKLRAQYAQLHEDSEAIRTKEKGAASVP